MRERVRERNAVAMHGAMATAYFVLTSLEACRNKAWIVSYSVEDDDVPH